MRRRFLVVGARGMLGQDVLAYFRGHADVRALGHEELDITDLNTCLTEIARLAPEVVINCAAYTKVDTCETGRDLAYRVNAKGPENLARASRDTGSLLVHVSTDFVFDGQERIPYPEIHPPAPLNVYGASKLAGEEAIVVQGGDYLIVRTAWLYGTSGPNFVKTMMRLASEQKVLRVVDDQVGSPTFTADLAEGLWWLVNRGARGVVHCTNQGACSWYELAQETLRLSDFDPNKVQPISTSEFPLPARRPSYSVLDNSRFEALTGRRLRPWQEALKAFLGQL